MIRRQHNQGHQMAEYINPVNGYRGSLQAKGKEVKNHMKENRAALRKTSDAFNQKRETESKGVPDPFKMKKFQNVQSRVKRNMRDQDLQDELKPVAEKIQRPGSATAARKYGATNNSAFGRSVSGTNVNQQKGANQNRASKNSARGLANLNKNALDQLNSKSKPMNKNAQIDQQIQAPAIIDQENISSNIQMLPPRTPNYGKTPKYINKYKEEAKAVQESKEQLMAAKQRPPGTKILPENERIETLENLHKNKKEVDRILMQMPISMRTESLRRQKIELEQKLLEIDRAIEMFSRKIVYVKDG